VFGAGDEAFSAFDGEAAFEAVEVGGALPEEDLERWYAYMKESIVEAVIGKDILQNRRVANPALFRQAFEILCHYPAQEISFTKLLGQLQDRGNTDLVKYYIELYGGAVGCLNWQLVPS